MNRDRVRQITILLTLALTITVNALANILPINGQETGEISDRLATFFAPAGYVFSIWGLIYLLLAAFSVYQALPAQRENPRLRRAGFWPAWANLFNAVWIFTWHYNLFPLSLLVMLALLVSLIVIYLRLEIGRGQPNPGQRWLVNLPFQVYLGWITVATVANAAALLVWLGWDGFGIDGRAWSAVMLAVASVVALLMTLTRRDAPYLLVLIWAFIGIALKFAAEPLVPVAAWLSTGAAVAMALGTLLARRVRSAG